MPIPSLAAQKAVQAAFTKMAEAKNNSDAFRLSHEHVERSVLQLIESYCQMDAHGKKSLQERLDDIQNHMPKAPIPETNQFSSRYKEALQEQEKYKEALMKRELKIAGLEAAIKYKQELKQNDSRKLG